MTPLQTALAYAEQLNWPVFPRPNGRFIKGSHGWKDATRDLAQIRAWWTEYPTALIAMPTGRRSGVVVLDIDVKHGKNGWDTLRYDRELAEAPVTPMVLSPHGGTHLYFADNPDCLIGFTQDELGPGLDVLGTGTSVPLPTPGYRYRWTDLRPSNTPLMLAPKWLAYHTPQAKIDRAKFHKNTNGEPPVLAIALERIASAPLKSRHKIILREAFLVGTRVAVGNLKATDALDKLTRAIRSMCQDTKGNVRHALNDLDDAFTAGLRKGRR